MESNKRAVIILLTLILSSIIIFFSEKKLLAVSPRGGALSSYEKIPWTDKILLLIEDFEGMNADTTALVKAKFFTFGSAKISLDHLHIDNNLIASKTDLKVEWKGTDSYGGWGKGVGANIDLNPETDYLNFRIYVPKSNGHDETIKITLEEDDNDDGILEKDKDDVWVCKTDITAKNQWQIISIPLKSFTDDNQGGDHIFNITRKGGLHTIIFSFERPDLYTQNHTWYFDFICFSNKKIENEEIAIK
jgi:hypothetical protein